MVAFEGEDVLIVDVCSSLGSRTGGTREDRRVDDALGVARGFLQFTLYLLEPDKVACYEIFLTRGLCDGV